jgi:hypothetical protein
MKLLCYCPLPQLNVKLCHVSGQNEQDLFPFLYLMKEADPVSGSRIILNLIKTMDSAHHNNFMISNRSFSPVCSLET